MSWDEDRDQLSSDDFERSRGGFFGGIARDDTAVHDSLTRFGVKHDWEVYQGDHVNRIATRFDTVVLPFFAKHLATK